MLDVTLWAFTMAMYGHDCAITCDRTILTGVKRSSLDSLDNAIVSLVP